MKTDSTHVWLIGKVKKRIPAITVMVACNVGRSLFEVAFALGTRQIVDSAVSGDWVLFKQACIKQVLIILGLLLCLSFFRFLKDWLMATLDRDWKRQLLKKLLHGEYASVSSYHSGELINRMTNDVRVVNEGLMATLPNLAAMITRLVAVAVVLIGMEPVFAIAILAVGVLIILVTGWMRKSLKNLNKSVSESDGKVAGMIQEVMEKLLAVQAMDMGHEVGVRVDALLEQRFRQQAKKRRVSLFANTSVSVISYGCSFAALIYSARGLLYGTMTFGKMTALIQLVSQLQAPFVGMSGFYPQYVAMLASAERLKELFDIEAVKEISVMEARASYQKMTCLSGRNVSFTYDRTTIFDKAQFELPKGAFAVITGASGIGKSTLLKLMLGIYQPSGGGVFLEGDTMAPLGRTTRGLFAYVPQGNLLLSGTLLDNLLLVKPEATKKELEQAIYVSAMDEYLIDLPLGLNTPLRENAAGLSEGQAQRLALARAILSGAPILLLDEVTSALDETTETKVLGRIKELKDRTCLVVTHRPAAIALCDIRLEINNGKITRYDAACEKRDGFYEK